MGVSPFAQARLDEAFGLSVGLRRVRPGEQVLEAEPSAGPREGFGAIARSVIGHHTLDLHAGTPTGPFQSWGSPRNDVPGATVQTQSSGHEKERAETLRGSALFRTVCRVSRPAFEIRSLISGRNSGLSRRAQ